MMMTDRQRAEMTASCRDTDIIPKVWDAGKVIHDNGLRSQIMHNGLKVQADGYCGEWMTNIIDSLDGHHEPQEELLFFELLKHARQDTSIIELGSYWAYYSCWYLKDVPGSRAICIEPNPQHLQIGKKNAEMNGFQGRIEFKNAWVGHKHDGVTEPGEGTIDLDCLSMDDVLAMANDEVELLHVDIQGAELDFLRSMNTTGEKVRFLVLSTHHKSISGSSTTHRDCIQSILDLGGFIMDEHDIDESFSGDGLIVAGFHQNDRKIKLPPISRNIPENSLFPPEPFISYAQNFEDVMLWRALKHVKNGFYVDVGANDPVVDSVSKAFYDRGWRGIHFEPLVESAKLLRKNRPDETVFQVALGETEGVLELAILGGLSTANEGYAQEYVAQGHSVQLVQVPVLTLRSALKSLVGKEVHWLKIDVEGFEGQVLKGWDSDVLRPWVMVIEATVPNSPKTDFAEWDPILVAANYRFVYFDGLNRFYIAEEHLELLSAFEVPPNVFDRAQLSGMAWSDWCKGINEKAAAREAELKEQAAAREAELKEQAAAREAALKEQAAAREAALKEQAAAREAALKEQAAAREAALTAQASARESELLAQIKTLQVKLDNGPLRLRQLFIHPLQFCKEIFNIPNKSKQSIKWTGYVNEYKSQYYNIYWILRHPKKAFKLLIRQPRKVVLFATRHPRKFLVCSKCVDLVDLANVYNHNDLLFIDECKNLLFSGLVVFKKIYEDTPSVINYTETKILENEFKCIIQILENISLGNLNQTPEVHNEIKNFPRKIRHLVGSIK
jgi:FkbM family methyltransferase